MSDNEFKMNENFFDVFGDNGENNSAQQKTGPAFTSTGDPSAQQNDPFAQQNDPFAQQNDPFAQQGDPFAQQGDPFAQQGDPFAQQGDPFAQQGDPFAQQGDPFAQQGDPFASQRPANTSGQQTEMGKEEDKVKVGLQTDVDITFVIDITQSMTPVIEMIKGMAMGLRKDVEEALKAKRRTVRGFRARVIGFRDYYCDGEYALVESDFFNLPEEEAQFHNFVLGLKADGGGDAPENALEAIALAMKSPWVTAVSKNERARNVILVFTDAPAHPLEKAQDGKSRYYPSNMLTSLAELKCAWEGQNMLQASSHIDQYRMNQQAKRMIIYCPSDSYPWNELAMLKQVTIVQMQADAGCGELNKDALLADISGSLK